MILNETMNEIADAIREKKGTTEKIAPINFAEEIKSISAGGGESEDIGWFFPSTVDTLPEEPNDAKWSALLVHSFAQMVTEGDALITSSGGGTILTGEYKDVVLAFDKISTSNFFIGSAIKKGSVITVGDKSMVINSFEDIYEFFALALDGMDAPDGSGVLSVTAEQVKAYIRPLSVDEYLTQTVLGKKVSTT